MNGNEAHPVDFMNHDHAFNLLNNGMAMMDGATVWPGPARAASHPAEIMVGWRADFKASLLPNCCDYA